MITAQQAIQEAQRWLGMVQGDSNHRAMIDAYNAIRPWPFGYKVTYTDYWGDAFITFVFDRLGAASLIGRECGVQRHIAIFKSKGIWIEDGTITPKPGDIICYSWRTDKQPNDAYADHIGIVEKVEGNLITLIEGNLSQRVARRSIYVADGYIRGYARPKYSAGIADAGKTVAEMAREVIAGEWGTGQDRINSLTRAGYNYDAVQAEVNRQLLSPSADPTPAPTPSGSNSKVDYLTLARQNLPVLKQGSTGDAVKVMQAMLSYKGFVMDVDGHFGAVTDRLVKQYQKAVKTDQDGVVGPETWRLLLS